MVFNALFYPFKGSGWIMVIIGAVLATLLKIKSASPFLGGAVSLYGSGYFISFYFDIIASTVTGGQECPDWPSSSNFWFGLFPPLFKFTGALVLSFLPLLICLCILDKTFAHYQSAFWGSITFGCLYFPMSILGIVEIGNMEGALPHVVLPAVCRCLPGYLLAVAILAFIVIFSVKIEEMADEVHIWGRLLSSALSFYFLMVQARFIGLLYVKNEERIGWS